jgi:hypothetical protein
MSIVTAVFARETLAFSASNLVPILLLVFSVFLLPAPLFIFRLSLAFVVSLPESTWARK